MDHARTRLQTEPGVAGPLRPARASRLPTAMVIAAAVLGTALLPALLPDVALARADGPSAAIPQPAPATPLAPAVPAAASAPEQLPVPAATQAVAPATVPANVPAAAPEPASDPFAAAQTGPNPVTRQIDTGSGLAFLATGDLASEPAGADLYAASLAARLAGTGNTPRLAAEAYERVWQAQPEDRATLRQAVDAWLEAGDVAAALRLARQLPGPSRSGPAALVLATDAITRRREREVPAVLEGAPFDALDQALAGALQAGAAAMRRDWEMALAPTQSIVGVRGLERARMAGRGLILELAGRSEDALVAYTAAWNGGLRTVGVSWLKARAEAAAGRWDSAGETLQLGLAASGQAPLLIELASSIEARRVPRLPAARDSAAWGLFLIGEAVASEQQGPSPVPALSLALILDPRLDPARVPLAAWLIGMDRTDDALVHLADVGPDSAYRPDAVVARAWLLYRRGATEEAEALVRSALEAGREAQRDRRLVETLAYFDLAAGRHEPAQAGFSELIAGAAPAGVQGRQLALYHYNRAVALEGLDRWDGAEADFRQALTLDPRNPVLLNGLGYGLADRGLKLDEALRLLRQAARLDPRNGAILDSLGWALFRAGDYPAAVAQLERAAALAPASAEVIDHLGDAYWRAGREDDARIEWTKARTLERDPARQEAIARKLAAGLPAVAATSVAAARPGPAP
jgi:tetratricopeptide (TPR) repeat protein